jgi:hypothetical protein
MGRSLRSQVVPALPSSRSIPFGPLVAARRDECPINTGYETVFVARDERRTGHKLFSLLFMIVKGYA